MYVYIPVTHEIAGDTNGPPSTAAVQTGCYIWTLLSRSLHCVAACCSALQCGAVWCRVLRCVAVCCNMLQCVAEFCEKVHLRALRSVSCRCSECACL